MQGLNFVCAGKNAPNSDERSLNDYTKCNVPASAAWGGYMWRTKKNTVTALHYNKRVSKTKVTTMLLEGKLQFSVT
jgi:hypothetical protein